MPRGYRMDGVRTQRVSAEGVRTFFVSLKPYRLETQRRLPSFSACKQHLKETDFGPAPLH